jgi:methyl-accepting chemotaxis protein
MQNQQVNAGLARGAAGGRPTGTGPLPKRRWRLRPIRDWRINTKLVAVMLLLAVAPVLIISALAQGTMRTSLTATQQQALLAQTQGLKTQVEGVIKRNQALAINTAESNAIVRYAAAAPTDRASYQDLADAQLRALLAQDPAFEAVGLADTNGNYLLLKTAPTVSGNGDAGTNGAIYYQQTLAGNNIVSGVSVSPVTGHPSVFYGVPVRDQNQQIVGVILIHTNTAAFQQVVEHGSNDNQAALLLDELGIVLNHGTDNSHYQYHTLVPLSLQQLTQIKTLHRFGDMVQQVDYINASGFADAFNQNKQVDSFIYTLSGTTYYAALVPVTGVPWRVVVTSPAAAFTGPVSAQTSRNLLLGLVVLAAAAGLGFLTARQLTRPLRALDHAAQAISAGDYDVRVPVYGHDELGEVARTVNTMVSRLTTTARQQEATTQALQRQIVQLLDEVATVAEGDLTVEADVTADALGALADSFNYMIGELRQIIGRVNQATAEVGGAAEEILTTTEVLSQAAGQQAARIADTSTAVETMAESIQQVAEHATQSAAVARAARTAAAGGAAAVNATVAGMARIQAQVHETARTIARLGASSQEIGTIVALIQEVADQTELLALNAAIQAAMAGEHGKGFAVVAEEVRRLAERTGAASKQIGALVQGIQAETAEAVAAMASGTSEVQAGTQVASEAGQALARIDATAGELAGLIEAISLAAAEQAQASAGIARAMGEISAVTVGTTAGAEQAAASVAGLARLATDLRHSVAAFRLPATGTVETPVEPDWSGNGSATTRAQVAEYAGTR